MRMRGAFVEGRVALLANEVVWKYKGLKKEGTIFKRDFEKVYYHVKWGWLEKKNGFGGAWRK